MVSSPSFPPRFPPSPYTSEYLFVSLKKNKKNKKNRQIKKTTNDKTTCTKKSIKSTKHRHTYTNKNSKSETRLCKQKTSKAKKCTNKVI